MSRKVLQVLVLRSQLNVDKVGALSESFIPPKVKILFCMEALWVFVTLAKSRLFVAK